MVHCPRHVLAPIAHGEGNECPMIQLTSYDKVRLQWFIALTMCYGCEHMARAMNMGSGLKKIAWPVNEVTWHTQKVVFNKFITSIVTRQMAINGHQVWQIWLTTGCILAMVVTIPKVHRSADGTYDGAVHMACMAYG